MDSATNPRKIALEFDGSAGLTMLFALILVSGCIWCSELVIPSVLSSLFGTVLAGVAVFLVKAHRYREALGVIRSKIAVAVIGGAAFCLIYREPIRAGAFAFGMYTGFWITMWALRRIVAERLAFIGIGADLEKSEIQDILK